MEGIFGFKGKRLMTCALVSGGTGLVGRYIVEDLLANGYRVKIGARNPPTSGFFSREVEHVRLDLDPDADNSETFDDVHHFVHAAFHHVPGRYRGGEGNDPEGFRHLNLCGSARLFETAKSAGVRRCVFLSSRAVYDGIATGGLLAETMHLEPATLYGEVKFLAEQALANLCAPGFTGVSLRMTGVYGDLCPNKWDALFADYLAGREVVTRAGSEVHGGDVGQAVRLLLESDRARVEGQSFNISDILIDTREILSVFREAAGTTAPLPSATGKSEISEMDTSRIRTLGWNPGGRMLLEETIRTLASRQADSKLNA